MTDRSVRSAFAKVTCMLEMVFACITFSSFTYAVYVAGAFDFAPNASFKWHNAFQVWSPLFLPVAIIVAAAVLLWLRSRWGVYLTFFANVSGAAVLWLLLSNDLRDRVTSPSHFPAVTELGLASLIAILLTPVVLLSLPTVRREFDRHPVSAATAGRSPQAHT